MPLRLESSSMVDLNAGSLGYEADTMHMNHLCFAVLSTASHTPEL